MPICGSATVPSNSPPPSRPNQNEQQRSCSPFVSSRVEASSLSSVNICLSISFWWKRSLSLSLSSRSPYTPISMAWLLIIISVILLWVASLCKIFHTSCSPSKAAFLNNGEALHKRNVLLVVAHPDDESMFFSPTITYLTSRGHNLHILCMSTGNADGIGNIRKEELYQACAILKVPLRQVKILDNPDLQDGFGKMWNHNLLAKIIEEEVISHGIDSIITFDNYGVSGHCNHRDVHHGIRMLLQDTSQRNIEAWELVSTNILRKYSGPVDAWLSILWAMQYPSGQMHCLVNQHPQKSFLAMAQHMSQWVWFRKLFVSFSSYTYVNTLKRIDK